MPSLLDQFDAINTNANFGMPQLGGTLLDQFTSQSGTLFDQFQSKYMPPQDVLAPPPGVEPFDLPPETAELPPPAFNHQPPEPTLVDKINSNLDYILVRCPRTRTKGYAA